MSSIGVLINPHSGSNRRLPKGRLDGLREIFAERGVVIETQSKEEVPGALEQFRRCGVDVLAVSGGDGTIRNALSTYFNMFGGEPPIFVPLRGGTMNMVAGDVGSGKDQFKVAQKLKGMLEAPSPLPVTRRGMLKVIDANRDAPIYCFCLVEGFLCRLLESYYRRGAGTAAALRIISSAVINALFSPQSPIFQETRSRVCIDDNEMEHEGHLMIIASSIRRMALGFTPFTSPPAPGVTLNFIRVRSPYLKAAAWRLLQHLYLGVDSHPNGTFTNTTARKVEVEGVESYAVDGEIINNGRRSNIEIHAGPTLRVISFAETGGRG